MATGKNNFNPELNKYYWAFLSLIIMYPKQYLNTKGNIIFKVVLDKGQCRSITKIARFVHLTKPFASLNCHHLERIGHIDMVCQGNRKTINFSPDALKEGMHVAKKILRK